MKKIYAMLLVLAMVCALTACGDSKTAATDKTATGTTKGKNILKAASSFSYASLDAHAEYYGWYTQIYGITESLFKIGDDMSIQPWTAKSATLKDQTWTIVLQDGLCFSNGKKVTADMVIRNIKRIAEKNDRFADIKSFRMEAVDDSTFTVTTDKVYATLPNYFSDPVFCILDLDDTTDFDNAPISTGPFVIEKFNGEGKDLSVKRNDNYWGGKVKLDGAYFYYMQEDAPKMMAMQNGEIDVYNSVTADAMQVFAADPDHYTVTDIPATRLQFGILNKNTLSDNMRKALNLIIDKKAIAQYLGGTVTPASAPYNSSAAYADVTISPVDLAAAKKLIEAEGYKLNADGLYEKDGKVLKLNIAYYAARSLDTMALLLQEQFRNVGIDSKLTVEEDPDTTYISTGDYDIALYCMISDTNADPYYFINNTLRTGSFYSAASGYGTPESDALIDKLEFEADGAERAKLANQIVQMAIDDNAFSYIGLFNKITVSKPGFKGFAENNPMDFYGIDANTTLGN